MTKKPDTKQHPSATAAGDGTTAGGGTGHGGTTGTGHTTTGTGHTTTGTGHTTTGTGHTTTGTGHGTKGTGVGGVTGIQPGPIDPSLYAKMERAALDRQLSSFKFITTITPDGSDLLKVVLQQDPAAIDALSLALGQTVAEILPVGQFNPQWQAIYKRQLMPNLQSFAYSVSSGLNVLSHGPTTFAAVGPGEILDLGAKGRLYSSYKVLGMRLNDDAVTERQLSGAFVIFLIDRVLTVLDRRFTDPVTSQGLKNKYLEDFAGALISMDDVLQNPVARKQDLSGQRQSLALTAEEAQAEAALQETALRVRQNLVLPREALFAAARRHQQQQLTQPGPGLLGDLSTRMGPSGNPKVI